MSSETRQPDDDQFLADETIRLAEEALSLREAGVPLYRIAKALGYSSTDDVRDALQLARNAPAPEERLEDERELYADRLDRLILGSWKHAVSGDSPEMTRLVGDLLEARSKLLGLGRPQRHEP